VKDGHMAALNFLQTQELLEEWKKIPILGIEWPVTHCDFRICVRPDFGLASRRICH
jgi:hypothetical protein